MPYIASSGITEHPPRVLDGSYDEAEWQWKRQVDGHFMLIHQVIPECFVSTDWPMEIIDEGPARLSSKYFGNIFYGVAEILYDADVGEAHYFQAEKPFQLSAFGVTRCRQAAEQLLINLEQRRAQQGEPR